MIHSKMDSYDRIERRRKMDKFIYETKIVLLFVGSVVGALALIVTLSWAMSQGWRPR